MLIIKVLDMGFTLKEKLSTDIILKLCTKVIMKLLIYVYICFVYQVDQLKTNLKWKDLSDVVF